MLHTCHPNLFSQVYQITHVYEFGKFKHAVMRKFFQERFAEHKVKERYPPSIA